jgi:hypothetical protein
MQVFLTPENFTAATSNPSAMEIHNGLLWEATAPGNVTITGNYLGFPFANELTVVPSDNSAFSLPGRIVVGDPPARSPERTSWQSRWPPGDHWLDESGKNSIEA